MVKTFSELPDFFKAFLTQTPLKITSSQNPELWEALNSIGKKERKLVRALIRGLRALQAWQKSRGRSWRRELNTATRVLWTRGKGPDKRNVISATSKMELARDSQQTIDRISTLILLGYMLRIGRSKVRNDDWFPLTEILELCLPRKANYAPRADEDDEDKKMRVKSAVRVRIIALRKREPDADAIAKCYFDGCLSTPVE